MRCCCCCCGRCTHLHVKQVLDESVVELLPLGVISEGGLGVALPECGAGWRACSLVFQLAQSE